MSRAYDLILFHFPDPLLDGSAPWHNINRHLN